MATRHANDHYPTPTALTLALLKELPQIGGAVIEPCAAEGKIADILRAHSGVTGVITNDIDATMPTSYHGDATDASSAIWVAPADWIVTNPPFNQADQFVRLAWWKARRFTGNGRTDSTTTAWFVWQKDRDPKQGAKLVYATNWC